MWSITKDQMIQNNVWADLSYEDLMNSSLHHHVATRAWRGNFPWSSRTQKKHQQFNRRYKCNEAANQQSGGRPQMSGVYLSTATSTPAEYNECPGLCETFNLRINLLSMNVKQHRWIQAPRHNANFKSEVWNVLKEKLDRAEKGEGQNSLACF
jgi:hypothetical protein